VSETILHVHPDDGREWECQCARCGSSLTWESCDFCGGEGLSHHDCGEDSCCCEDDSPNVMCEACGGHGGWNACLADRKWCEANPLPGREDIKSGTPAWFTLDRAPADGAKETR
jgi:hypothetical protein